MTEKIDVIVANPAGNTTIMVLTEVPVSKYQEITEKVLDIDFRNGYGDFFPERDKLGREFFAEEIYKKEIKGEQVSFLCGEYEDPETGIKVPAMNMSGLEFCGNATRAFAYYEATIATPPVREIKVKTSGCDYILEAEIDQEKKTAKVQMPLPSFAGQFDAKQLGIDDRYPDMDAGVLIDMDGISHLVLKDVEATPELFEKIKSVFYSADRCQDMPGDFPAFGVMFIDTKKDIMTPVVYVHDVDTTYFEGSCASGTTAAAYVVAMGLTDGKHEMTFCEPAGTLYPEVTKEAGKIEEIRLNGLLELSDVISVSI